MLSIERQFVRTERPLYSHLVSLLETAIAKGDLLSGARVPPERALAQQLKISRTTVVSAYRELESRGLLRGYVGRGTFVCAAPEPDGRRRGCCLSRRVSRRSTSFPPRPISRRRVTRFPTIPPPSGATGRRKGSRR